MVIRLDSKMNTEKKIDAEGPQVSPVQEIDELQNHL